MPLSSFGFGERELSQWAQRLKASLHEIRPGGPWHGVIEQDTLQPLPENRRQDTKLLLLGLIASSAYRADPMRPELLMSAQVVYSYWRGTPGGREIARQRSSLAKDHISRFESLLIAGYAACGGDKTISKPTWEPLAPTIVKIMGWDAPKNRPEDDDPGHQVYKAFSRRFHDLRKKNGGSHEEILAASRELFTNLRNFISP